MELLIVTVIAYAAGMLTGKTMEAWLWRNKAADFAVRKSLGKRYSVRRVQ